MITIIADVDANRAIGNRNRLLYHLSADLRRFKALTTGHTVIMGRRTFESLPKGALPQRRNLVLTRDTGYTAPGIETFTSLESALGACTPEEEIFIIGCASVYAEALPMDDRLCLTHVADTPDEADAFFPEYDETEWRLTASESHEADERNAVPYTFADYERL
ncbi:MAG: dihydrofolate reductase [Bacteroidaceae bacterium]|nr:dihydrofolate reductase [Bacteroidaceae bacterium]